MFMFSNCRWKHYTASMQIMGNECPGGGAVSRKATNPLLTLIYGQAAFRTVGTRDSFFRFKLIS
jgi:hypothetical protein